MTKTKTYGILTTVPRAWGAESRQARVVVAASSRKAAVEAMRTAGLSNMTAHHLSLYGAVTGNDIEIAVTQDEPGVVFWAEDRHVTSGRQYHRVESTINGMSLTCEKRIAGTGSRCKRPVGHDGLCHPRQAT